MGGAVDPPSTDGLIPLEDQGVLCLVSAELLFSQELAEVEAAGDVAGAGAEAVEVQGEPRRRSLRRRRVR
jgi:hypothetical protein